MEIYMLQLALKVHKGSQRPCIHVTCFVEKVYIYNEEEEGMGMVA